MPSKRANVFEEILPYVNSGDWERVDQFIVFGKAAFDAYVEEGVGDGPPLSENLRQFLHEKKTGQGQQELLPRISFNQPPPNGATRALQKIADEVIKLGFTEKLLEDITNQPSGDHKASNLSDGDDAIDAALAATMIQELRQAYIRASGLDKVSYTPLSCSLPALFEEAHRCDLRELKMATAILCRAVLEDSLKKAVDPRNQIKLAKGDKESYIDKMLESAKEKGILDEERVKIGKEIKQAGNNAAHNPTRFSSEDRARVTDSVDGLRKLLEDLHNAEAAVS